jgi:hypothetical protein
MLHIHFGAGRLGLGLVAPFFQKPGSELILLNRAQSGKNETGDTELAPERKAQLLKEQPQRLYGIQTPGEPARLREVVGYTEFRTYNPSDMGEIISDITSRSSAKAEGVVVTASVVNVSNYSPVVKALNQICDAKERGEQIGDIYLVACENTVSAHEVFQREEFRDVLLPCTGQATRPVHGLVDRMCVGLEEYPGDGKAILDPTVLVRAEEYGSLKLEITPETEALMELCKGSKIEFSRHLDVEKKIKGWLLNGTHWLIALTAFEASKGNTELKLNEYLAAHPQRQEFAAQVIHEISEGIEIMLRNQPEYAAFVRDISPRDYLDGASAAILRRFSSTEDSISRILARFRKPCPDETTTIENFVRRFFDRVDPAIAAYAAEKGVEPPATSHGLVSLCRLLASGTFVNGPVAA